MTDQTSQPLDPEPLKHPEWAFEDHQPKWYTDEWRCAEDHDHWPCWSAWERQLKNQFAEMTAERDRLADALAAAQEESEKRLNALIDVRRKRDALADALAVAQRDLAAEREKAVRRSDYDAVVRERNEAQARLRAALVGEGAADQPKDVFRCGGCGQLLRQGDSHGAGVCV